MLFTVLHNPTPISVLKKKTILQLNWKKDASTVNKQQQAP
jgi:hypothetical protein